MEDFDDDFDVSTHSNSSMFEYNMEAKVSMVMALSAAFDVYNDDDVDYELGILHTTIDFLDWFYHSADIEKKNKTLREI